MPCFHRIGKLVLKSSLLNRAENLASNVVKEGSFGVTVLEHHSRGNGMHNFLDEFDIDISSLDDSNLIASNIMMSKPQEEHSDEGILEKYGILVMLSVPEGSVLKQSSGPEIPLSVGDVVRIRYHQLHELFMPNEEDRLVFCCIDFRVGKRNLDDQWRALVNEASGVSV